MADEDRFRVSEVLHATPDHSLKLIIAGQPCALQRPRFQWRANRQHGGGMYRKLYSPKITVWNPSKRDQALMRQCIEGAIRPMLDEVPHPYFFQNKNSLSINLAFYMPRPNCHFRGGMERLYENVQMQYRTMQHIRTPDIDNLVKFMLDEPLEGLVYGNDSHVTRVSAMKGFDNVGDCSGRIIVDVSLDEYIIDVDNLPR